MKQIDMGKFDPARLLTDVLPLAHITEAIHLAAAKDSALKVQVDFEAV